MNISYDIFDLADFPIILTDKNFVIIYKNNLAAKLFGKLRKRSKIIKHFRNFKSDIDFSNINELDIETGTHFMRALTFPIDGNYFVFLFFTLYSFTDTDKLLGYIRGNFAGNLLDFYCTAYREFKSIEKKREYERALLPERAYSELMFLVSSFSNKPEFMCAEVYSLTDILSQIAKKLSLLSAFGLSIYYHADYSEPHFTKINLKYFTFNIFRLIYTAFKLSRTGKLQLEIDASENSFTSVSICTETSLQEGCFDQNDFSSLVGALPEFSFEFDILKKFGIFENSFKFSIKNSILELYYLIDREATSNILLRSEPQELRKMRIEKTISNAFAKIKHMLSTN